MHVLHHPEALEGLEVAVHGREVGARYAAAEAAGDFLGAHRPLCGEERLEHEAPRGRQPQATAPDGGRRGVDARERKRTGCGRRADVLYCAAPPKADHITCGTARSVSIRPTPTISTAETDGRTVASRLVKLSRVVSCRAYTTAR